MRYIHYVCLRRWLDTRVVARVSDSYSYFLWKTFDCELCKSPLPLNYQQTRVNLPLVAPDIGKAPAVTLESVGKAKHRVVTVISISNDCSVMLGRGHGSDLRIPDISVSRCHAQLSNRDGRFFIADIRSKFGTLVQVREPVLLRHHSIVSVQVGRSVLRLEVKEKRCMLKSKWDDAPEGLNY
jgi:hypothetical protein